ncbi:DUF6122 family protein [Bergeyella sp. RCAD1439]|uniref:DUF6122 family protein n=1 Tax=Bergeyella anatis TaxID=3113737 RepID=UPI002E17BEBF|nr:DUF6122 family protein [Bergeyella sp. RCAD1439]
MELKIGVHYGLHFVFPLVLALVFFRGNWKRAYGIMLATMLVDLDHVLADPLFDPDRNSIGFHPLHTYPMIAVYFLGVLFTRGTFRVIFVGLLFHMFTDWQDYYLWR